MPGRGQRSAGLAHDRKVQCMQWHRMGDRPLVQRAHPRWCRRPPSEASRDEPRVPHRRFPALRAAMRAFNHQRERRHAGTITAIADLSHKAPFHIRTQDRKGRRARVGLTPLLSAVHFGKFRFLRGIRWVTLQVATWKSRSNSFLLPHKATHRSLGHSMGASAQSCARPDESITSFHPCMPFTPSSKRLAARSGAVGLVRVIPVAQLGMVSTRAGGGVSRVRGLSGW